MYNKLYAKIVHSSIWLSPDPHRIAWITFLALMDQDGFVNLASPANLAHVARLSIEDAKEAVLAFESPDPLDSGQEHEGRRIEKVPGGYMVLNAVRYREAATAEQIRARTRERVKAYRIRKAGNAPVTQEALQTPKCNAPVTPSEAGSETEAETPRRLKATRKSPRELPDWFIEFKSIFPRRAGDPDWAGGLRAANARISEGHNPREFTEGARRYAAYIEATKRGGTDFIQQASRFLGSGKPFSLPWNAPAEAESDWDQMMRLNGGKDNGPGRVFENTEPGGTALEASVRLVRS